MSQQLFKDMLLRKKLAKNIFRSDTQKHYVREDLNLKQRETREVTGKLL